LVGSKIFLAGPLLLLLLLALTPAGVLSLDELNDGGLNGSVSFSGKAAFRR